jgi:SPP1 family phage portal protein
MLTVSEIKAFMDSDAASTKKRLAKVGLKYYEGNHDINNYRIFFFDADGKLQEDKTKSNIRISHPFFKLLTDQQAQYMLSAKDGFVKSDIPELQTELDAYFNENESFAAELYELLVGCISKGFEYMYAYKDENDRTAFQTADSIGVVEVREKETDDGCAYVIYWYIERIGKDNKKIKRIQVWDNTQTVFYCQEDDGKIELDKSVEINPRPHILYKKDGDESTYYEDYGLIPFFRLDNGKKQVSGVKPIKDLIDDYDLMNAGLSNNIQDTNEALYVVRGFQGDNLDELMLNIKAKKHIGVDDEGGVDIKTVDIPVEARKTKMEVDESNIYRFGMGFNSAQVGDGNITNVVIKSRYALLDMKCDGLLPSLKQFMRKLLKLVLKEINDTQGTDYTQNDVYFDFTREIITNEQDNAQIKLIEAQEQQARITTLLNLSAQIGNEVLMEQVCDVLDLDYTEYKDRFPKPETDETAAAKAALNEVVPEE